MVEEIKEMDSLHIDNFSHFITQGHLDIVMFGLTWLYENIFSRFVTTVDYEFIARIVSVILNFREIIHPAGIIVAVLFTIGVLYFVYTYPYKLLYDEIGMRSPGYAMVPILDVVQLLNAGNMSGFFIVLGVLPIIGPVVVRILTLIAELRMYKDFGVKRNPLIGIAILSLIPLPIVPWVMAIRIHEYNYKGKLKPKYLYETTVTGML